MDPVYNHNWNLSKDEAIALQLKLAKRVYAENQFGNINTVVGVDVAYDKNDNYCYAAATVLNLSDLKVVEIATSHTEVTFPYIPGLLSFREAPAIIEVFKNLTIKPDLIICDGNGVAHPRRFGLACHIGILYDIPTIGCAKNWLLGSYQEPGDTRGSFSKLIDADDVIGVVLRTQNKIKPIFVSVGHKISLQAAIDYVLELSPKYRIPEPIRLADQQVRILLKH